MPEIRETGETIRHAERVPSWSWASITAPVENGITELRSRKRDDEDAVSVLHQIFCLASNRLT